MKKKLTLVVTSVLLVAALVIGGTLAYFTDTHSQTNTFTVGNVKITLDEAKVGGDGRTSEDQTYGSISPNVYFTKDPTITVAQNSQDSYIFLDITLNKYKSLVPVMALDAAADATINFTQTDVDSCIVDSKFSTLAFLEKMKSSPEVFRAIIDKWFVGIDHENWRVCGFFYNTAKDDTTASGNWMTVRLAYIGNDDPILSASEKVTFMEKFGMPSSVTQQMLENGLTANQFNEGDPFQLRFTAYAIQADTFNTVEKAFTGLFGASDAQGDYWHTFA